MSIGPFFCQRCHSEMIHNVPRLGNAGGFVHKDTGRYECAMSPEKVRLLLNTVSEGDGLSCALEGLSLWLDQQSPETAAQVLLRCEERLARAAEMAAV